MWVLCILQVVARTAGPRATTSDSLLNDQLVALDKHGVHVEWRHELSGLEPGPDCVRAGIDRYEKESRGYVVAHTEWVVAGSATSEVQYVVGADGYS